MLASIPESQWAAVCHIAILAARLRGPGLAPERRLHSQAREGVRGPARRAWPQTHSRPCTSSVPSSAQDGRPSARVFFFFLHHESDNFCYRKAMGPVAENRKLELFKVIALNVNAEVH